MWLLALDRSSPAAGAALFCNGELVGVTHEGCEPARSPQWMARLAAMLRDKGVETAGLATLCAGLGPGSFSGIRSSLAGLHGLALPDGIAVRGVSSAAALAYCLLTAPDAPAMVSVVGDARRNRLWAVTFKLAPSSGVAVVVPGGQVVPAQHTAADFTLCEAAALVSAIPASATVVSPDYERLRQILEGNFDARRLKAGACNAAAAAVGRLYLAAPGVALCNPLPIYLHPAVGAAN